MDWLGYAIPALIMWGLWGFFPQLAGNYIGPNSALIFQMIGNIIVTIAMLIIINFKLEISMRGIVYSALAGLANSLGVLFFIHSLAKGGGSIVVTITALYPITTIILSFLIFKEAITLTQGIGIVFALIAMYLLST